MNVLSDLPVPAEVLRFSYIQEQGSDSSCGLACLATVLSRYFGVSSSERLLIEEMAADGGTYGASMAELAKILERRGIASKGFKFTYDELEAASGKGFLPMIVHYDKPTMHWALLLRAEKGFVVVSDPARGTELLSRRQFMERWSGAALLVARPGAGPDLRALAEAVEKQVARRKSMEYWERLF